MGTQLAVLLAPEFLAALLGVTQDNIDRAFELVEAYRSTDMATQDVGFAAYKVMMADPVASILSDYQQPFEYEGTTYGGTLCFGKWGFRRAWNVITWQGLDKPPVNVDPVCGSLSRTSYPPEVDTILNALRYEDSRNLNWVVLADHCTGVNWA